MMMGRPMSREGGREGGRVSELVFLRFSSSGSLFRKTASLARPPSLAPSLLTWCHGALERNPNLVRGLIVARGVDPHVVDKGLVHLLWEEGREGRREGGREGELSLVE